MGSSRGGMDAWQFPQGGIQAQEDPEAALFRELQEEIGLTANDVRIMGCTRGWLRYRLPPRLVRRHQNPCALAKNRNGFFCKCSAMNPVSILTIATSRPSSTTGAG